MTRIHIVGVASRTGTTLMAELMHTCFRIDGYAEHELSIFRRPSPPADLVITKSPVQAAEVIEVLRHDPDLWVICMMRDPRDVVVSRHGSRPDIYWTNLRLWKETADLAYTESRRNPRYILVRYEDLVSNPDETQQYIEKRMPFLKRIAPFSKFHEIARPSGDSLQAMRGVRPISNKSVGIWRNHKPRLAAQIQLHGDIDQYLIELGYESDHQWKKELTGVTPDNQQSFKPEFDQSTWLQRLRKRWKLFSRIVRHRLGITRKADIIINKHNSSQ